MTTQIINKLTETLTAKTEAALSQLAGLEQQIAETIARAEQEATARIETRLQTILTAADEALCGYVARVTEHAADAFQRAVDGLAERLEPTPQPVEVDPIPTPTPDPIPSWDEVRHDLDRYEAEQDATADAEPEETSTVGGAVAAYALDQGYAATIDDDDLMETAADHEPEIATTDDPRDLYERRGQGRGTRYVEADLPIAGHVYYRKIAGKWTATTYVAG